MKKLELNGTWLFKAVDKYRTLPRENRSVTQWMNSSVPGTVHTDLLANEKIPDPFYRMNEDLVQWVDSQQWIYRREIEVDEEFLTQKRIDIVAEGLDTYSTIRINGKLVGTTADMFVEHRFNAKRFLHRGKNTIEILFDSPVKMSKALEKKHGALLVANEPHRVYVRKAQYSFGWDWGPRLTTSGIWRNISLEAYAHAALQSPFIRVVSVTKSEAILELSVEVPRFSKKQLELVTLVSNGDIVLEDRRRVTKERIKFRIKVGNPRLWWPNGYGEQPMYHASFSLVTKNEEIERTNVPFAIRTVKLVETPDKEGKSFIIEINGEKIFCKGADWIPNDTFIPRVPDSTYEKLLVMAKSAHMNMVRVWGGGIYEQEIFYELCDRLGLMIWHDFMFACGEYPEESWFLNQVEDEASKALKRLRNHPSIVLWCGNNECEWNFCKDNPGKSPDDMNGAVIFREILPSLCRQFDGTRPYWRSSPFGKGFPNDESNGNHHQWAMWGEWKDYKEYENDNARFVTEFGFQAPAHGRTIESVTIPADRHPLSRVMEHHNKLPQGGERIYRFQAGHVTVGKNFDDFIYKGQLVQAEALKTAVEHWRRRKFMTAGSLFWQLNDCWPVTSWSIIDSALRPKATYYYAKKFFAPTLVSFRLVADRLEVWGTHDLLAPLTGELEVTLCAFDGSVTWLKRRSVRLGRNSSAILMNIRLSECAHVDHAQSYVIAQLKKEDTIVSENRYFFVESKHMNLQPAVPATELARSEEGVYFLTVASTTFAKNISVEIKDEDIVFDDNFFDIDAAKPKHVRIASTCPEKLIREKLRIRSLWETLG